MRDEELDAREPPGAGGFDQRVFSLFERCGVHAAPDAAVVLQQMPLRFLAIEGTNGETAEFPAEGALDPLLLRNVFPPSRGSL